VELNLFGVGRWESVHVNTFWWNSGFAERSFDTSAKSLDNNANFVDVDQNVLIERVFLWILLVLEDLCFNLLHSLVFHITFITFKTNLCLHQTLDLVVTDKQYFRILLWLSEWIVFWNFEMAMLIGFVRAGGTWLLFGDDWEFNFVSSSFYLVEKLLSISSTRLWNLILNFGGSSSIDWNHDSLFSRFESIEFDFPTKCVGKDLCNFVIKINFGLKQFWKLLFLGELAQSFGILSLDLEFGVLDINSNIWWFWGSSGL